MIKLILKLCFICSFVFLGTTQAALIDVTQEEYYITFNNYNNSGIDIDVAWVSEVNTERYYFIGNNEYEINTLYSPDKFHEGSNVIDSGWHFAEDNALSSSLLGSFSSYAPGSLLAYFTTAPEIYINAFEHWNSYISEVSNTANISANEVGSEWVWNIAEDDDNVTPDPLISKSQWNLTPELWSINDQTLQKNRITDTSRDAYDTLYFRVHNAQIDNTTPVPEPTTLMIFALGLITLANRKKLMS